MPPGLDLRAAKARKGTGGVPFGIVLWLLTVALWLTLAPFATRTGGPVLELSGTTNSRDAFANLFLLAPIGLVLGAALADRSARWRLWTVLAVGVTISAGIEFAQRHVETRIVAFYDVLFNAAGAVLAAHVAVWLRARGVSGRTIVAATAFAVLGTVASHQVLTAVAAPAHFSIADWNPGFHMVVGDEWGGERPFEGRVEDAGICAGTPPQEVCASAGASLERRRVLTETADATQRIVAFARIRSDSEHQVGPARIITFSEGTSQRNLTLGQEGTGLAFRIRTPFTGENGARPQYVLPEAIRVGEDTRVSASFDRGYVRLRAEAATGVRTATFRPDLINRSRAGLSQDLDPGMAARAILAAIVVLNAGIGWLWGWTTPRSAPLGLASAVVSAGVLQWASDLLIPGGGPEVIWIGIAVLAAGTGFWLGRLDCGRFNRTPDGVVP